MASPRISLARVLELGVRVNWREAVAIVHEALARTRATDGARPARVTAESCLLTRGGDVVLVGAAAQARPEAVVRLLDDLLASCSNPGRFAGAVAEGTALDMIEEQSHDTTPQRRRVAVASVALRGLAAAADAARAMVDADEQNQSADVDGLIAAPTPAASPTSSPTAVPRPSVTALAPPSAMPTIHDQPFALRGDAAVGDAEVRRPGLDHEDLIAAVEAAPTPAASPTSSPTAVPRPSVTALAPPSAMPTIHDQTFALLGDSAVGDADQEDLIAAVEAAREWAAPEDAVAALASGTSPAQGTRPSVTPRPASFSMDLPSARPLVIAVWASAAAIVRAASAAAIARAASAAAIVRAASAAAIVRAASAAAIVRAASAAAIARTASAAAIVRAASAAAIARAASAAAIARAASAAAIARAASAAAIVRAASAAAIVRAASAAAIVRAASAAAIVRAASAAAIVRAASAAAIVRAASAAAIVRAASAAAIVRAASAAAIARTAWASATVRASSASANARTASASAIARTTYVRGGYSSPFDQVKRASPVALVWSVLAVAAGGILGLQLPETRRSAVEPSEPAIEPPEIGAPVGLDGHTPLARPEPALLPKVADSPSVPPLVARSAPRGSPRIEDRRAPFTRPQDSVVRSIPRPAGGPQTPAKNIAMVAGSRSPSATSAAAALLAPDAANAAGAPPPAVDTSSVVASPSATASSPAETFGSGGTYMPVNAVARPPDRELEARAIENVLGRYRTAFNKLDAGAALAVWPTVNEKTLAKAFESLESHDVSFQSCKIEIFSVLAEAACSGSARYVPRVGSRTPRDEARRWRFSLRKASGGWLIDSVDAR